MINFFITPSLFANGFDFLKDAADDPRRLSSRIRVAVSVLQGHTAAPLELFRDGDSRRQITFNI